MRRILKQKEPDEIEPDRIEGRSFGMVRSETKRAMQRQLCIEQGYLCCFCESQIEPIGRDMRIAHFVPQDKDHSLELTWSNLYGCCHGNAEKRVIPSDERTAPKKPGSELRALHCDAKQSNECLDARLRPDSIVEGLILFRSDGSVYCAEAALTKELEAKLNLNHPRLKKNRVASLDALIDAEAVTKIPATDLIQRVPNARGRLSPYLSYLLAMVS